MIFDVLNQQIDRLKELQRLQKIKENRQQQQGVDKRYSALVVKVNSVFAVVSFAKQNLDFEISDKARGELMELLTKLRVAVRGGYADGSGVDAAEKSFNFAQATLRKDWKEHYNAITAATLSTLRVIGGIDPQEATSCIADIKAAESWPAELFVYNRLKNALDRATGLIQRLDMDAEVIEFLQKMTNGKASIADLSPDVLAWIRREGLQEKVRLSFIGR